MENKTKQKLMDITRELIDTKGLKSISMRMVGSEANLSHMAVYRHFSSKDSLIAAIVVENFKLLSVSMKSIVNNELDSYKLLHSVIYKYYIFAMENPHHYQLMFNTNWDEEQYPEIKESAQYVFQFVVDLIFELFSDTQLKKDSLLKKTAILYSFIHGLVELHLNGHNSESKGLDNVHDLIDNIVYSLF